MKIFDENGNLRKELCDKNGKVIEEGVTIRANSMLVLGNSEEKRDALIVENLRNEHGSVIVCDRGLKYFEKTKKELVECGYQIRTLLLTEEGIMEYAYAKEENFSSRHPDVRMALANCLNIVREIKEKRLAVFIDYNETHVSLLRAVLFAIKKEAAAISTDNRLSLYLTNFDEYILLPSDISLFLPGEQYSIVLTSENRKLKKKYKTSTAQMDLLEKIDVKVLEGRNHTFVLLVNGYEIEVLDKKEKPSLFRDWHIKRGLCL